LYPGDRELERAIAELASRLPAPLQPLARVAYDYRWSWALDGPATFEAIDADGVPQRWVAMMRRSLMTHGPRFCATRMVREYVERLYRA
jgi:starch phosphorylase